MTRIGAVGRVHLSQSLLRAADRTGLIVRVATSEPAVAMSFDDGPDPIFTPLVLDVLREQRAQATFFVDGQAAERSPKIVRRIVDEGHEVGLHGWTHTSAEAASMRGLRIQTRELQRAKQVVAAAVAPRLYRPPYGHESRWTRLAAAACNLQLVYWSASTEDWRVSSAEDLAGRIRDAMQPGAIVLMHDRLRTAVDPAAFDRGFMVDALQAALSAAPAIEFVTISQLRCRGATVVRRRRHTHPPLAAMVEQPA